MFYFAPSKSLPVPKFLPNFFPNFFESSKIEKMSDRCTDLELSGAWNFMELMTCSIL